MRVQRVLRIFYQHYEKLAVSVTFVKRQNVDKIEFSNQLGKANERTDVAELDLQENVGKVFP